MKVLTDGVSRKWVGSLDNYICIVYPSWMEKNDAYFTYDPEARAYYFAPRNREKPPYRRQQQATAILDIAEDGTLAGVELIIGDLPLPPSGTL